MSYPTVKMKDITLIKTGKLDSNAAVDDGAYPFFTCDPNTLKINNWAYDTEAVLLAGNNASGNYTAKYYKGKFNAYQRVYIIETADPLVLNIRYLCYALNQQLRLLKTMSSGSTTKFLTLGMLHGLLTTPSHFFSQLSKSKLYIYLYIYRTSQRSWVNADLRRL